MTSIDEIFKKSGVSGKRKLDDFRNADDVYKSAKLSSNGRPGKQAHVSEEDGEEDDAREAGPAPPGEHDEDDGEYGPSAPPPDENEDEEGRFFGGGITAQESEILDFVDETEADQAPEKIDISWLKKTALNFEKRINKNAELRAKYESQPAKFIESEADLDADIKALSILGEHPELYGEFARLGCVGSLVSLLAHENTDIAIDAVEIVGELTDEDVAATDEQWDALIDALLEADLLGLLVSNFSRLDESEETDRNGVYYALGVIEHLTSRPDTAEQIGKDANLLKWLLQRIQKTEQPISQNKQYSAEILAILAQSSAPNRRQLAELDTLDVMLQLVAPYRKRDPEKGGEEEEYMENLFECLSCVVDEPLGKTKFIEAEGVELCLIMLKEGKMSKPASLRLLDHAAGGAAGTEVCLKLVDAGGLKTLFTTFMKTHAGRITEHLIGIFASMLRLLPGGSAERVRTLAKFVEKDYEKTNRVVKLRSEYATRVAVVDEQIRKEAEGMDTEEREELSGDWLSRRLDAGLFSLQTLDIILAWLVAEDDGASKMIKQLLGGGDDALSAIRTSIQEQIGGVDTESDDGRETKDMLTALVQFLQ